jgi:hypothetical protein
LYLAYIADAIAAISISGVTVKDKDQIVGTWISSPGVLFPNPENWITDFGVEFASLLQGVEAPINVSYTLNYRYLGSIVGDISSFPSAYSALVDKLVLIINAMLAVSSPYSGRINMVLGPVDIGPKEDLQGDTYFGADIALRIEELQN